MRSGQQNKRGRGRNNTGRKNGNPLSRTYDSTGPDVKIRGTAQHIADKYGSMARDALSAGDAIMAENYLQHAEHYNRIIASAQAQMQERYQREEREAASREQQAAEESDATAAADGGIPATAAGSEHTDKVVAGTGPQPVVSGMPPEVAMSEDGTQHPNRHQANRRRSAIRPRRNRGAADAQANVPVADENPEGVSDTGSSSGDARNTVPEVAAAAPDA